MARVLIGCEESGKVRDAFAAFGHEAYSCDLKPSRRPSNMHFQCDIREVLHLDWDLLFVAHSPCTRLCNSGVRWLTKPPKNPPSDCTPDEAEAWPGLSEDEKLAMIWEHLDAGAQLFSDCWNANIDRVAVENPVMHHHAKVRIRNYEPAAQHVQPHWFGDPAFKSTGLYLRNLPTLERTHWMDVPSKATEPRRHAEWSVIHRASPGDKRREIRSETFDGIAHAMASQWGSLLPGHDPEYYEWSQEA